MTCDLTQYKFTSKGKYMYISSTQALKLHFMDAKWEVLENSWRD